MPVYRPLKGEILQLSKYESIAPADKGDNISFAVESVAAAGEDDNVSFAVGSVTAAGKFRPFQPIDFGKPLSIVIRRIYTGRFPEKHVFSNQKPMLVSSAIRDITTTSAGARALNMLRKAVGPGSEFSGPGAAEDGTVLVYYSPAMATPFVTISLTMIFEDFPQELFDRASALFGSLAGVPIFMPAMGYLLGASTVVKLAGNVGSQVLNGRPVLDENIQLDFSFGGGVMPTPGFWILSSGVVDVDKYEFDPNKGLIDKSTSRPYDGPDPVIVVSVDGGGVEHFPNFTPLLVSASVLGRFFNQKDGSEVAMDTALDAVKLLNDLTYRKKAEETKARLASLAQDSPDRQKLQDALKTFNANIGESRLKLDS